MAAPHPAFNKDLTIGQFLEATASLGTPGDLTRPELALELGKLRQRCLRLINNNLPCPVGDFHFLYDDVQRYRKYC